ncbi:COG3904 family protein [Bradyrhizobium sp. USDA 4451]
MSSLKSEIDCRATVIGLSLATTPTRPLAMRPCRGRSMPATALVLNIAVALFATTCLAMEFSRVPGCFGDVLKLRDDIRDGDFVRFRGYLGAERRIVGLDLDSGGGSLYEGFRIAMLVHQKQFATYVSGECDSACAFIFLAGAKRYVAPDGKIGVHSVSNMHGNEDLGTLRDTIKLARLSAKLRVPPSVIGKMVMTPPGRMAYLNREELASLKVVERNPFDRVARTATSGSKSSICGAMPSKSASEEERPIRITADSKGSLETDLRQARSERQARCPEICRSGLSDPALVVGRQAANALSQHVAAAPGRPHSQIGSSNLPHLGLMDWHKLHWSSC